MNMSRRSSRPKIPKERDFEPRTRRYRNGQNHNGKIPNDNNYMNDCDNHEQSEDELSGMGYSSVLWAHPRLPQAQTFSNQHRQPLFTAMSDPSVCSYPTHPLTFSVDPFTIPPPLYSYYQPTFKPNYKEYRNRHRTNSSRQRGSESLNNMNSFDNEHFNFYENTSAFMPYQTGDYTSLPPDGNIDKVKVDKKINSEHRRYSDPGLGPADNPNNVRDEDSDSTASYSSSTTGKDKMYMNLVEQLTKMKEANSQLFKELHQTKVDLETVKNELNQLKQNISSDYQPGMLSDLIREIREASKVKEERMIKKMTLFMETQESSRQKDFEHLLHELELIKVQKVKNEEKVHSLLTEVSQLKQNLTLDNIVSLVQDKFFIPLLEQNYVGEAATSLPTANSTFEVDKNSDMPNSDDDFRVLGIADLSVKESSSGVNKNLSAGPVTDL
ncbi:hypothetical protein TKK_0011946 [Trichogramma kaykai]|uniref:Uncharacterized protein n=1 Tax=Trichogramma kaykai TaxID=54128 RepID=A0ABD2WP78_9HYME